MRTLAPTLSALLLVATLALFAVVATAPPSLSGLGYASALVAFSFGVGGLSRAEATRRRIGGGALALLVVTVLARLVLASGASRAPGLRMATPSAHAARWVDRLVDEEDLAVNASRAIAWTGFMRDPDVPALPRVMSAAYGRMRHAEGTTPSPVLATYAGLERPGDDDTIEVGDVEGTHAVVLFLHGFAGSFTLPCWVVSHGAMRAGFATVCPSTRWVGDWWSPEGEATLRETLVALRRRGVRRIVLAGLSNGGIGASLLAPRFRGSLDGLVLISGASPGASSAGVPTLVLQGEHDAQISAGVASAYADRVGASYRSFDAGHFAMLLCEDDVVAAMASFLRTLPRGSSVASVTLHAAAPPPRPQP